MGCIPQLIETSLSTAESSNSYGWYITIIAVILSITLAFIRTKLPPIALEGLARQITEVDDALTTSTRIIDPHFTSHCDAILER